MFIMEITIDKDFVKKLVVRIMVQLSAFHRFGCSYLRDASKFHSICDQTIILERQQNLEKVSDI